MKKIFSLLLAGVMIIGLAGCEQLSNVELPPLPTVTPETTEASPSPSPTAEPTPEPEQESAGAVTVNVKHTLQQAYDPQNGTELILSFSYDTPVVYIEGGEETAAAVNERIALMDEAYYTGNEYDGMQGTGYNNMLTMAEDNYRYVVETGAEGVPMELASDRSVSVPRIDSQVLTLLYNDYMYTGGAHGSYGYEGYCFDLSDGHLLTLEELSSDYEALSAFLVNYMVQMVESDEELAQRIDISLLPEGSGYAEILSPLLREGSWYFSSDGLVIFPDLYEISSYAAGIVEFVIPYDALTGYVDEKWIPVPVEGSGSIELIKAEDMVDGSTPIVDKLVVGQEGAEFYLVAQGSVSSLSVTEGDYADKFYPSSTLWSCSALEDGALQMVCPLPEGMPEIQISYRNDQGQKQFYLTVDGEGSPTLTDTVEAVG